MTKLHFFFWLIICLFSYNSSAQISQPGMTNTLNNTMNTPGGGSSSPSVTPLDVPPHRGVVKPAGKYYIEVVVNWMLSENNTVFYLLKSDGKAVEREKITCSVEIQRIGIDPEVQTVKHYGLNAFSSHLISGEEYHVKVSFKKKKKEYSAIFQTNGK